MTHERKHLSSIRTMVIINIMMYSRSQKSSIENNHFMIFLIDDHHNIHTKHRPKDKTQTQAIHMTTLLLKVFPEVQAVSNQEADLLAKNPVEISNVEGLVTCSMSNLSKTYAEIMPDWVVAKYFDPEAEAQITSSRQAISNLKFSK